MGEMSGPWQAPLQVWLKILLQGTSARQRKA